MSLLKGLAARLRSMFASGASEARMEEEFRFHLTMETERLIALGCGLFVELGPGGVLAGLLKRTRKDVDVISAGDVASVRACAEHLRNAS